MTPADSSSGAVRLSLAATAAAPEEARAALDALADGLSDEARFRLRLLATELVTNSVRHAELPPGGRIELEAARGDHAFRVSVRDGGAGFVPHHERAPVDAEVGRGLDLVDALAARWAVERAAGETCVWFELALDQPVARDRDAGEALHVAIADDYELFAMTLASRLELSERIHVVGIATSGRELIELVAAHETDLALVDLRMPTLDGIETARRIRATGGRTRVAVISALFDDDAARAAEEAGAIALVHKDELARDPVKTVLELGAPDVALRSS